MPSPKELGEFLRSLRADRALTLEQVEQDLSIRVHHLEAIEEGQFESLISPVYARGFVKQYAVYLGLDGDHFIREHREVLPRPNRQEFNYGIGTMEARGAPNENVRWLPNLVMIALSVLALIAAWFMARKFEII